MIKYSIYYLQLCCIVDNVFTVTCICEQCNKTSVNEFNLVLESVTVDFKLIMFSTCCINCGILSCVVAFLSIMPAQYLFLNSLSCKHIVEGTAVLLSLNIKLTEYVICIHVVR